MAVRAAMYSTARTDVRPPATALRPRIRTRIAIDRGDANQGSNLMAAGPCPEFGQFSEKSPCGHVADARNGFQERLWLSRQAGECLMASPMSWSIASNSFWR